MYPIPEDCPIQDLVGSRLREVSFAAFSTYLGFSDDSLITAEGTVRVRAQRGGEAVDLRDCPQLLLAGMEQELTSVVATAESHLELTFASGLVVFFENDPSCESFHLRLHGIEYHF